MRNERRKVLAAIADLSSTGGICTSTHEGISAVCGLPASVVRWAISASQQTGYLAAFPMKDGTTALALSERATAAIRGNQKRGSKSE